MLSLKDDVHLTIYLNMAKKTDDGAIMLSALEQDLLTLIQQYADGTYGLEIMNRLNTANQELKRRKIGIGSLYPALKRMAQQGLLSARWGEEGSTSGGARRRYYCITALGEKALNDTWRYRSLIGTPLALD